MSWSSRKKKEGIFAPFVFPKETFFNISFISMYSVLNVLSKYTYFYISINISLCTFQLIFKIVESFQCILRDLSYKQCIPVVNDSTLPLLHENLNETLSYLEIIANDFGKVIKALNVIKAHSHNEIPIKMLKPYESAIGELLYLIFQIGLSSNTLPDVWGKANVIPVQQKGG